MKNSYSAVLLVFLLALLANAQEAPLPMPNDSSLAITPDSSSATTTDSSLAVVSLPIANTSDANASEQEKVEKKTEEKKTSKKREYSPEDYQKNLRVAAYLHPLPLFFGAAYNMFMFSSTIEIPLSLSNSVIIQPVVWAGGSDGFMADIVKFAYLFEEGQVEYERLKRAGVGIGLRRYAVNKSQGFYLQAMASMYYISAERISYKDYDDWDEKITSWTKAKGVVGELIFYIGSAHKWQNINFSYEAGMGFGYDGTDTYQMGYTNRLATNFNLCIGIPFF